MLLLCPIIIIRAVSGLEKLLEVFCGLWHFSEKVLSAQRVKHQDQNAWSVNLRVPFH